MAAGHQQSDGQRLHRYWTVGAGRAKWNTWTELFHHLLKYLSPERAKLAASRWFFEVKGYYAGDDRNRVANGKPPRGKKIGPG